MYEKKARKMAHNCCVPIDYHPDFISKLLLLHFTLHYPASHWAG